MAEKGLESLNCPLCLDVYVEATLVWCGHTFCRTCLVQHHTSRQGDSESISCPLCRRETQLGSGGVAGLPANITVNGLVEEVRKIAEKVKFEQDQHVNLRFGNSVGLPAKWDMVKEIAMPGMIHGLCVASPDSVLDVASLTPPCVYIVTLNGPELNIFCSTCREPARDVTVLSTGKVLVLTRSGIRQFDKSGSPVLTKYKFTLASSSIERCIDSDWDGNIYVSHGDEKLIRVFKPTGGEPERMIKVRSMPWQVHTTRCGRIVVQSVLPSDVSVLEASGEEVTTISKDGYFLFPAVDEDDNLYIASIPHSQDTVSLEKYTLSGEHVRTIVKDFKIKSPNISLYYLKCPSRNTIVLCSSDMMYIFKYQYV